MNKVINEAIYLCGGRKNLAEKCKVSTMTIGNWLNDKGINSQYLQSISDATEGRITVEDILKSLAVK